jgi:hypothetical protein
VAQPQRIHTALPVLNRIGAWNTLQEFKLGPTDGYFSPRPPGCQGSGEAGVGFHLRQHPLHIKASQLIGEGTIGPAVLAHAQLSYGVRGQVGESWRTGMSDWWPEADLVVGAFAIKF